MVIRKRGIRAGVSQTLVSDKCLLEGFHSNPIDDDDNGWESDHPHITSVYTQDIFQNWHNFEDKNHISDQGAAKGSTNNSENHAGSPFRLKSFILKG